MKGNRPMDNIYSGSDRLDLDFKDSDTSSDEAIRLPGQRCPDLTRRSILDAATVEFVAKGFAGASVNEIADRANVNKRMLYHYFGKKDKLYVAVLERVYASLRAAQGQLRIRHLPPVEAIEALTRFTWDYYVRHPEFLSLMATENMLHGEYALRSDRVRESNAPLMDLLNDILQKGQQQGVFRQNVDPLHLYLTIASLGAFYVATRFTLSNLMGRNLAAPEDMDNRLQHIIDVVLGYLRP